MRQVLLEGLLVALAGGVLAFAANGLSPRGLKLTRDFFGVGTQGAAMSGSPAGTNRPPHDSSAQELLAARLHSKGLQLASSNEVVRLFQDPRTQQGLVIFVDARDDAHYQQGHIPGAYQFDYYHPEAYLGALLPVCQLAQTVVVYCKGGQCEDSEFAATFLLSAGLNKEKLLVYGGGMAEWRSSGLPVETGDRLSGQIQTNATKSSP